MKVICINDRSSIGVKSQLYTKGVWYDVVTSISDMNKHMIYILSDNDTNPAVERKNFLTLEEYRNYKLEELGI